MRIYRVVMLSKWLKLFFFSTILLLSPSLKASSFQPALKSNVQSFPRILGVDRSFAYEWWYLTAHLFQNQKKVGGLQVTLFRLSPIRKALPEDKELLLPSDASYLVTHTAFTDLNKNTFFTSEFQLKERLALTTLSEKDLDIKIPGLSISYEDKNLTIQNTFLKAKQETHITLQLNTKKGPIFHGKKGYSKKGPCNTCASHYVSFTDLQGKANLHTVTSKNKEVFEVSAWFDHEQGTNTLSEEQVGWDWFGVKLNNGYELMLFQLRDQDQKTHFKSGTLIFPDGRSKKLEPHHFKLRPSKPWTSSDTEASYPQKWRIQLNQLAAKGLPSSLLIQSEKGDQEVTSRFRGFPTYWEGTCTVFAGENNQEAIGHSYLEMTGYDEARQPRF
jgi:predicted secreted hydrolase